MIVSSFFMIIIFMVVVNNNVIPLTLALSIPEISRREAVEVATWIATSSTTTATTATKIIDPSSSIQIATTMSESGSSIIDGNDSNKNIIDHIQRIFTDPNSYSSLLYIPKQQQEIEDKKKKYPLLVFLHGAGKNNKNDIWDLADRNGQYGGLLPSLIETNTAPKVLTENFVVVSPYCTDVKDGISSFYNESRSKLLNFVRYSIDENSSVVDPSLGIFLFGFSDGATVSIELLTTRKFRGAIVCSYGYTGGTLPTKALQLLSNIPIWVFHSADDTIFPIKKTSDVLVRSLRQNNDENNLLIRYSRFDVDPENFAGAARGHTTGITASKNSEVYDWLLSLSPLSS